MVAGITIMKDNAVHTLFFHKTQENFHRLTKADKKAADFMINNLEKVIYLSISELADLASISEASIVRLCRKLGYTGFQDLKIGVARELVTRQERIHEQLCEKDDTRSIIDKIFNSTIATLEMTKKALDSSEVSSAINAISNASKVVIVGSGNSAAIARDAFHKFLRLGLNVHVYCDGHMQMLGVSAMSEGDVLIAISHSGSSRNIVDCAEVARSKNAHVICITASGSSPLAKRADIKLFTYSSEVKYRLYALSSRMAVMVIIDAVYIALALKNTESALQKFESLERALASNKY